MRKAEQNAIKRKEIVSKLIENQTTNVSESIELKK